MLQSEAFLFSENVFGYIPSPLLDLLTPYSTDVIFLLWNWTLNSPTSLSRWWNWLSEDEQDSVDQMVRLLQMRGSSLPKTARRPYSIFTALEHERVTSPACGQAVSCAICFRSKTLCHFAHRRGQRGEPQG